PPCVPPIRAPHTEPYGSAYKSPPRCLFRRSPGSPGATMGLLTFALNVTLDGCYDHREGIADDELHDYFTQLIAGAGAMLYGRTTYELMEAYWPAVAREENAPRAERHWARTLEAMQKYVVSSSRRDFPWNSTFRVEGELH